MVRSWKIPESSSPVHIWLVVSTHLKNISQSMSNWKSSPNRGDNKKYLKPHETTTQILYLKHAQSLSFWKAWRKYWDHFRYNATGSLLLGQRWVSFSPIRIMRQQGSWWILTIHWGNKHYPVYKSTNKHYTHIYNYIYTFYTTHSATRRKKHRIITSASNHWMLNYCRL